MSLDSLPIEVLQTILGPLEPSLLEGLSVCKSWLRVINLVIREYVCSLLQTTDFPSDFPSYHRFLPWVMGPVESFYPFFRPRRSIMQIGNARLSFSSDDDDLMVLLFSCKGQHHTLKLLRDNFETILFLHRPSSDRLFLYPRIVWRLLDVLPEIWVRAIRSNKAWAPSLVKHLTDGEYQRLCEVTEIKDAIRLSLTHSNYDYMFVGNITECFTRAERLMEYNDTHNKILLAMCNQPWILQSVQEHFGVSQVRNKVEVVSSQGAGRLRIEVDDPKLYCNIRVIRTMKSFLCLTEVEMQDVELTALKSKILPGIRRDDPTVGHFLIQLSLLSNYNKPRAVGLVLELYLDRYASSCREQNLLRWLFQEELKESLKLELERALDRPPYSERLVSLALELMLFTETSYQRLLHYLIVERRQKDVMRMLTIMWPVEDDLLLGEITSLAIRGNLLYVVEALKANDNLRIVDDELFAEALEINEKIYDLICEG